MATCIIQLKLTLAKQDEPEALKWVFVLLSPLSPLLFWNKELEHADHVAVCDNKTTLSYCYTLAQIILQLLQL